MDKIHLLSEDEYSLDNMKYPSRLPEQAYWVLIAGLLLTNILWIVGFYSMYLSYDR